MFHLLHSLSKDILFEIKNLNFIMDMDSNWFDEFALTVDRNKREIKWGFYAVALTGLGYALRSARPFKKFRNANEIPKTFIDKKIKLNGYVIKVEDTSILMVDHNPVFASRMRSKSDPGLAVMISGIDVSDSGVNWMRNTLLGEYIYFVLLKWKDNQISSIVYWNKKNLAEELLKLGVAAVGVIDFDLEKDKFYLKYYRKLLASEEKAEKKRLGIWAEPESKRFFIRCKEALKFLKNFPRFRK